MRQEHIRQLLLVLSSIILTLFPLRLVSLMIIQSPLCFLLVPSPNFSLLVYSLTRSSNERLRVGSGIFTVSAIMISSSFHYINRVALKKQGIDGCLNLVHFNAISLVHNFCLVLGVNHIQKVNINT
jgi:hypothetical protein